MHVRALFLETNLRGKNMSSASLSGALAPSFLAPEGVKRAAGFFALAVLGTLVMAIAAKITVPFFPVPMTLQTLAVFGIAAAFGRNLAVATMLLYIFEGLVGLPVFAGAVAGPAYMAGPTAGYLVGFVIAAALIGSAADRGWSVNPLKMTGAMLVADVVIFALGFAWLATLIGPEKAFQFGVLPFVLGDIVKIVLASAVVAALWKVFKRA